MIIFMNYKINYVYIMYILSYRNTYIHTTACKYTYICGHTCIHVTYMYTCIHVTYTVHMYIHA